MQIVAKEMICGIMPQQHDIRKKFEAAADKNFSDKEEF